MYRIILSSILLSFATCYAIAAEKKSALSSADSNTGEIESTSDSAENTNSATNPAPNTENDAESAQEVNVKKVKQKYWAKDGDTEAGVVQNRLYTKKRKFELGVMGGVSNQDPFIDVRLLGLLMGYHFSEYWAANLIYWKYYVGENTAQKEFRTKSGGGVNNNHPLSYYGGEVSASLLYGKLSMIGKKIIYFDLHLLAGAGMMNTETGQYFAPHVGIGQKIFLSRKTAFRFDYRMQRYNDRIKDKQRDPALGGGGLITGKRSVTSHNITLGISLFF